MSVFFFIEIPPSFAFVMFPVFLDFFAWDQPAVPIRIIALYIIAEKKQ